MILRLSLIGSAADLHHFSQDLYTSSEKKSNSSGHLEKVGTRRRRCRFERRDATECRGLLGWPDRFLPAACWSRDSAGMCVVMCGFCQAHLRKSDRNRSNEWNHVGGKMKQEARSEICERREKQIIES